MEDVAFPYWYDSGADFVLSNNPQALLKQAAEFASPHPFQGAAAVWAFCD